MRIDLHVHTRESSGPPDYWLARVLGVRECYSQPEDVVAEALRKGLDGVAITNHDRAQDSLRLAAARPDVVIPGCEYKVYGGRGRYADVLVLGIDGAKHERLLRERHRGLDRFARVAREEGLPAILAHPAWEVSEEKRGIDPEILCEWLEAFDLVETLNGNCPAESIVAKGLARYFGKPATGGSDAHDVPTVGTVWTEADAADIPAFLAALRAGRARPGGTPTDAAKFASTAREVLGAFYRRELLRAASKGSLRNFLLSSNVHDILRALGQVLVLPGLLWAPQAESRSYLAGLRAHAGRLRCRLVEYLSLDLARELAVEDLAPEERRRRWVARTKAMAESFADEGC